MATSVFPAPPTGPSLSEITTGVAAAVPTISAINTAVANNSPSPNNWTVVGTSGAMNYGFNTVTFSGLSGYKTYKILIPRIDVSGSTGGIGMRINGDTTSGNYTRTGWQLYNNAVNPSYSSGDGAILFDLLSSGVIFYVEVTINHANTSSYKQASSKSGTDYQYGSVMERNHMIANSSPVSSITLYNAFGTGTFGGGRVIYLLGAN